MSAMEVVNVNGDPETSWLIARALGCEGYVVADFDRAAAALDYVFARPHPVVLLIGGLHGLPDIQPAIEMWRGSEHVRLIATTGATPQHWPLGVFILPKPFDLDQLLAVVADAANERVNVQADYGLPNVPATVARAASRAEGEGERRTASRTASR